MSTKNLRQYNRVSYYQESFLDDEYKRKTVRLVLLSNMDVASKQALYTYGFIPSDNDDINDATIHKIVESKPMHRVKLTHIPPIHNKAQYIEHMILEDICKNHHETIPSTHQMFFNYIGK